MNRAQQTLATALSLSAAALLFPLALLSCGGDSGSGPDSSNSNGSSSSVYVAPGTDPDAPLVIEGFGVTVGGTSVTLEGLVYIDDSKSADVQTVDSIVFGVNPAGPLVTSKAYVPAGETDISLDLNARIDLASFEGCGDYVVYVTAYANGKPVTDSATFNKAESYCAVSSSSSEAQSLAVSSTTFDLGAQKKGSAIVALDLDAMKGYTLQEVEANLSTIDILLGCDGDQCYFLTPKDVGSIPEYQSFASESYTGLIYETAISGSATIEDGALIAAEVKPANSPASMYDLYSNSSYVVTTSSQANVETLDGVYLIQMPKVISSVSESAEITIMVWSVAK